MPTMRRCCCRATAARGAAIRGRTIIAKWTKSSPLSVLILPMVTMYALRHSSIVRMLLQNIPIRLVASLHNTSITMIERTYSRFITEHSDDISRKALLQPEPQIGNNVVAIGR